MSGCLFGERSRSAAEVTLFACLMNESNRSELVRAYQSIERRLALLAHQSHRPLSSDRRFRPRLWQPYQYSPRRVRIRSRYQSEKPPQAPPRIAIVTPSLNQGRYIAASIDSGIIRTLTTSSKTAG